MEELERIKEELVENFGYDEEDLEDLDESEIIAEYERVTDTSIMHPNEDLEDFLEHENFDD